MEKENVLKETFSLIIQYTIFFVINCIVLYYSIKNMKAGLSVFEVSLFISLMSTTALASLNFALSLFYHYIISCNKIKKEEIFNNFLFEFKEECQNYEKAKQEVYYQKKEAFKKQEAFKKKYDFKLSSCLN